MILFGVLAVMITVAMGAEGTTVKRGYYKAALGICLAMILLLALR